MDKSEIETRIIPIIAYQMGWDSAEVTRDKRFNEDLNVDSLDTVELTMEFEDEFDIAISDEEADELKTVGQVIDFIAGVLAKAK